MCHPFDYRLRIFYRGKNINQADGWASAWYVLYLFDFNMILDQICDLFVEGYRYILILTQAQPSQPFKQSIIYVISSSVNSGYIGILSICVTAFSATGQWVLETSSWLYACCL